MPFLTKKFPGFQSFAEANLTEIYGQEKLEKALHYEVDLLESVFIENLGNGEFNIKKLPVEAQFSPILDFKFLDIDKDGVNEIFSVGNMYNTEVRTSRLDASYGNILKYSEDKFSIIKSTLPGFANKGDARDICIINMAGNQQLLLVSNNNAAISIFKIVN
jgi:hypothetical protein